MHGNCVLAMICNALVKTRLSNDITRLASIAGNFGKPVLPGETLTIIGYQSADEKKVPFEVFNAQGKLVFREGLLAAK